MNLGKQKNLASRALGVSKKRITFVTKTTDDRKEISEAISRESIKTLVEDKLIIKSPKIGNSRTRANQILAQKKKGRQKGAGSRKGTVNSRFKDKSRWMIKIRSLRVLLKSFKDEGRLESKVYRDLYRKSKGNFFRNKRHIMLYINQNELLKDKVENTEKKSIEGMN